MPPLFRRLRPTAQISNLRADVGIGPYAFFFISVDKLQYPLL